ncbi:transmembrane GTPase fzo [Drosophila innubila]|uniref:transmembrane GTPase fzo n=1 Tax=Drosophila innubila TaxID=198719 RepID=UPI00148C4742|nr:transmembrane GTPase fzo [Drosophila innubila]
MCAKLSDFGLAKTEMLNIYEDMAMYLQQIVAQLQEMPQLGDLLNERIQEQLLGCINRIKAICPMLQRKHMKVAFFGRTSNGKSAVINAMLHERILPSAMGHTTSCFCQVEACGRGESAHVMIEHSEGEKLSIDSLRDLASAHSSQSLSAHRLLHVRWPSSSCNLLGHDVVLLDTPGVDVTAQLDECIDRHCLNADVFVLVLNAESTMSRVERQFFEAVAQQLSRPNLFILNNRWDVAATLEPHMEQLVRAQHTQRCLQLLIEELGIYSSVELARRRIFHVSALEALRLRQQQQQQQHAKRGEEESFRIPGGRQRYEEFLRFEREFASCITQSALSTKFEQHCAGAAEMLLMLQELLQQLGTGLTALGAEKTLAQAELSERFECWQVQIMQRQEELNLQLERLSEETTRLGTQLLQEQIQRLPAVVQQFRLPVQPQLQVPQELCNYQRLLGVHLEQLLLGQVEMQLWPVLQQKVSELQLQLHLESELPWQLYSPINCQLLMSDFQVDLQFRFSWGMAAIVQRICGKWQQRELPLKLPAIENCLLDTNNGSMASMLLLGGVLARSLSWRLLLVLGGMLGSFYVYELLSWTQPAQERSFKTQYTRHLQRRLRENVAQTATGFGQQVRQHLTHSMREFSAETEQSRSEITEELHTLKTQLETLENCQMKLKQLQLEAVALQQRITAFQEHYMPHNQRKSM